MGESDSTLGTLMRAAWWNAAGFKILSPRREVRRGLYISPIRTIDINDSGEEGDSEYFLLSVGFAAFFIQRMFFPTRLIPIIDSYPGDLGILDRD